MCPRRSAKDIPPTGGNMRVWQVRLLLCSLLGASVAQAAPGYGVLGQPTLADTPLGSRCAEPQAQFHCSTVGGVDMYGSAGLAIDPRGRLSVTDFGEQRMLTWPDVESLQSCQAADRVIGAGTLFGPEAVAIDSRSATVFVADTLSYTVRAVRVSA